MTDSHENDAPLARYAQELLQRDEEPSRDDLLAKFLEYTEGLGLELYPAQEEAILELLEWKHVILNTPTGSGKSMVAFALCFQALAEGRTAFYTCPIKALVNEKFFDLCDALGPQNVGLLTGDAAVNPDAPIICCTAEILSNLTLRDSETTVDYVVMDEFHFYGDHERGAAWQIPLVSMRDAVFLLMSATLGDTSLIEAELAAYTARAIAKIHNAERPVPLEFAYKETALQETALQLKEDGETPIYLVNFTQRACSEQAQGLLSVNLTSKQDKRAIGRELRDFRFDTPYGKELRRFLSAGIGIHHAGLLPKYRLLVERLAQSGLLQLVSGTDSLGVGVNIPIRCVLFSGLSKFDGEKTRILSARQYHQIAGRAGRKGFDDHGLVAVQAPEHVIENQKIEAKLVKHPHLRKKLRKRKPPKWGYVHWDKGTFNKLTHSPPEPLEPQFNVSHGMLIDALRNPDDRPGGGYRRLVDIIGRTHGSDNHKRAQLKRLAALFRSLVGAEIAEIVPRDDGPGKIMRVKEGFQENFSLNHSLSLFLVEALELLDPEDPGYALDVLSLVESILENPRVILYRQLDWIKGELIGRLKAEGVPYDERMDELEKAENPKPLAELIYDAFNAFARFHPWLDGENIRPKSIAREMYEGSFSFNDYILHLGAARSEGVLIRYLSQVYKTLVQNVPQGYLTEELEDLHTYLLTMLRRTDSSLLDEWQRLMDGELVVPEDRRAPRPPERPKEQAVDIAADPKRFARRVRAELHMLLGALAKGNYEVATELIRQTDERTWTAARFAEALAPFFAEHASIDVTPRARHSQLTTIVEAGRRIWSVQQAIVDPDDANDWALHAFIDLTTPPDDPDQPIIELDRIGI
jgi:hypothetical protein